MSSLITLTTDFGTQDGYVGAMKGVILSVNPQAVIIDITHEINAHDVMEGAIALGNACRFSRRGRSMSPSSTPV